MDIRYEGGSFFHTLKDNWIHENGYDVFLVRNFVVCHDKERLLKILAEDYEFTVQWTDKKNAVAMHDSAFVMVEFGTYLTELSIWYNTDYDLDELIGAIKEEFSFSKNCIRWVYDTYNSDIILPTDNLAYPISEMYPQLGRTIEEYYQEYLDSTASILILIGKPGTGKTTFINGLIKYSELNARVCYDEEIMKRDGAFSDFVDSDDKFYVMEDSDNFLRPREDGNSVMHKFLNVADGIIKTDKKLIFSTNLESVKDIDDALIRPGRCFDVLDFRKLDYFESQALLNKIGSNFQIESGKTYSIAELYNGKNNLVKKSNVGFY